MRDAEKKHSIMTPFGEVTVTRSIDKGCVLDRRLMPSKSFEELVAWASLLVTINQAMEFGVCNLLSREMLELIKERCFPDVILGFHSRWRVSPSEGKRPEDESQRYR